MGVSMWWCHSRRSSTSEPGRVPSRGRSSAAPGGVLILSTPNQQNAASGDSHNPFHLSEMTEGAFRSGVEGTFRTVRYFARGLVEARLLSVHAVAGSTHPAAIPAAVRDDLHAAWPSSEYGRSSATVPRTRSERSLSSGPPGEIGCSILRTYVRQAGDRSRPSSSLALGPTPSPT